jgi:hypothetical protein
MFTKHGMGEMLLEIHLRTGTYAVAVVTAPFNTEF